ncbi:MAG: 1,4-dihydroxy-6-naphthoate synthase [Bacteroidetes bacterium]|jgi:1,4-dihydroxy-6-naphthoate synthase|nr:1,4-dihydroxy-6-naphthoate synthase [Bacteroidota bacterium]
MKLRIGFSPCPNDTFIFDALVHGKIDTGEIQFEPILEDVETLNEWALEGKLDITKLSFPAFFSTRNHYQLLDAGSALGQGVGPILVTKDTVPLTADQINHRKVLLPGSNTTAHLLFSLAFPAATQKEFLIFSAIEETLQKDSELVGVLIHENRFTYEKKGLNKIVDLGSFWEENWQVPIPLGGIAIRRSFTYELKKQLEEWIRKSLALAWANYPQLSPFVQLHAQEMEEDIMRKHITLYVNEYSRSLGETGQHAINVLFKKYMELQNKPSEENQFPLFV